MTIIFLNSSTPQLHRSLVPPVDKIPPLLHCSVAPPVDKIHPHLLNSVALWHPSGQTHCSLGAPSGQKLFLAPPSGPSTLSSTPSG